MSESKWQGKLAIIATIVGVLTGGFTLYTYLKPEQKCPHISGHWVMAFTIRETNYSTYMGDVNVFDIYVSQDNDKLSGSGEQELHNGKTAKSHFKMRFDTGLICDNKIEIRYTLLGSRQTEGQIILELDQENPNHLAGTFSGGAANSSGIVDVKIQ